MRASSLTAGLRSSRSSHPRETRAASRGHILGVPVEADRSLMFTYLNRGKKSVTLDLSSAADRQRLRALAVRADVLVEDHQPGELTWLGLGYENLQR